MKTVLLSALMILVFTGCDKKISQVSIDKYEAHLNQSLQNQSHNKLIKGAFKCQGVDGVTCVLKDAQFEAEDSSKISVDEIKITQNWLYEGEKNVLNIDEILEQLPKNFKFDISFKGFYSDKSKNLANQLNALGSQDDNGEFMQMLTKPISIFMNIEFNKSELMNKADIKLSFLPNYSANLHYDNFSFSKLIAKFRENNCLFPTLKANLMEDEQLQACINKSIKSITLPQHINVDINTPPLPPQALIFAVAIKPKELQTAFVKLVTEGQMKLQAEFDNNTVIAEIKPAELLKKLIVNELDITKPFLQTFLKEGFVN